MNFDRTVVKLFLIQNQNERLRKKTWGLEAEIKKGTRYFDWYSDEHA